MTPYDNIKNGDESFRDDKCNNDKNDSMSLGYFHHNSPSTVTLNKHSEIHFRQNRRSSSTKEFKGEGLSPRSSKSPRRSSMLKMDDQSLKNNLDISDADEIVETSDLAIVRFLRCIVSIDGIVSITFLCDTMTLALPVILVPLAIDELASHELRSASIASGLAASQVAKVSSMAFMGGAVGKFVNGFICVELGTYKCSQIYMAGLACCSLAFSFSSSATTMGLAWAGLEFFSSVQYSCLAVMLSNYYETEPVKLASSLTALGLACTTGDILAKVVGTALSSVLRWRTVAQVGACVAIFGCIVISYAPGRQAAEEQQKSRDKFHWSSIVKSFTAVLGSTLFWKIAIPYSMAFVACYSDRILVPFFNELTNLPHSVCGGLTLSITLGLVHGLVVGSERFALLQDVRSKKTFLKSRYIGNVAATMSLAALSYCGPKFTVNKSVLAALAVFFSAAMASTVSFQVFHLPAIVAQGYGDNKAVCMSLLDGFGYFFSIPAFSILGALVPRYGWEYGWAMLAVLFAFGGYALVRSIGPILKGNDLFSEEEEEDLRQGSFSLFEWATKLYSAKGYVLCSSRTRRDRR